MPVAAIWREWDDTSEIYWLKYELPALATVRGWDLRDCYRTYRTSLSKRKRWWEGVDLERLLSEVNSLIDSPPQCRLIGDRQVTVDGEKFTTPIAGVQNVKTRC